MTEQPKVFRILDIDLDFFLNQRFTGIPGLLSDRMDPKYYIPWQKRRVRNFLTKRLGLNDKAKIKGAYFTEHDEVFHFLANLQSSEGNLKFSIDHVDAHSDLGMGMSEEHFTFIANKLLNHSISDRYNLVSGSGFLNSGNFMTFAIACQWIENLSLIYTELKMQNDIPPLILKDFDTSSRAIQLTPFSQSQISSAFQSNKPLDKLKSIPAITREPEVPLLALGYKNFNPSGKYDYVLLTQSPHYTPEASDDLIPFIKNYMLID